MAKRATRTTPDQSQDPAQETSAETGRMKGMGRNASSIVSDAAEILDDELAAGILAAKQVQDRFKKDRRIDPQDFDAALKKFNADAHELLTLVGDQISEASSRKNAEITQRLMSRTHDVLDLTVQMINIGAEMADQLAQKTRKSAENDRADVSQ